MTLGPGPISGWAIIKALGRKREDAAQAAEASENRAVLDEEELRELEEAEYEAVSPVHTPSQPPARRRSLLGRLLGR